MATRGPSGREIAHAERRRLAVMGLAVPTSLNYDETPVPVFLEMLKVVARHREDAEGGPPEGGVHGKLEGVFYEVKHPPHPPQYQVFFVPILLTCMYMEIRSGAASVLSPLPRLCITTLGAL